MTGWRVGYIGAPEWICNACAKIQGQFTSGANAVAQRATITALNYGIELTTEMKVAFENRRDLVFNLLCDIPGIIVNKPQGAFYFFPDVSSYFGKTFGDKIISNAQDLCLFILNKFSGYSSWRCFWRFKLFKDFICNFRRGSN